MTTTVRRSRDYDPDERRYEVAIDGEPVGTVAYGYFRLGGWGWYASGTGAQQGYPTRQAAVTALLRSLGRAS